MGDDDDHLVLPVLGADHHGGEARGGGALDGAGGIVLPHPNSVKGNCGVIFVEDLSRFIRSVFFQVYMINSAHPYKVNWANTTLPDGPASSTSRLSSIFFTLMGLVCNRMPVCCTLLNAGILYAAYQVLH